jgi:hypothetical protein
MAKLPGPSLRDWREGHRYLQPTEAKAVLELARKSGLKYAKQRGEIAIAAHRQVQVLDRILETYKSLWDGSPPPASTTQKQKQKKISKGKGGGLIADDVAGRNAEELVYRRELKRVGTPRSSRSSSSI